MKHTNFLNYLGLGEKVIFFAGAALEKISRKIGFPRLRNLKSIINQSEKEGYSIKKADVGFLMNRNELEIALRKNNSDLDVFNQVFLRKEYEPIISYIRDNDIQIKTVVDAGSNIGLTSLKLLDNFPEIKVICLEPDPENFKLLETNLKHFSNNVTLLPFALWDKEEELYLDFGFRDGKSWSRGVTENERASKVRVHGISMDTLIHQHYLETIDLLKIDIEGSEARIFRKDGNVGFLNKVRLIAIEIHDEFNCRNIIYDILRLNHFSIFNSGELTIGINRRI